MNSRRSLTLCAATLAMVLLTVAACQGQPPESLRNGVVAQWSGAYRQATTSATRTLDDAAAWAAAWSEAQRDPPRALDAAQERGIAIFLGERNTGGYAVELVSVSTRDGQTIVEWRERTPSPDMSVTQALTQPWLIAVIPRTNLPVTFRQLPSPGPRRE